MDELVVFFALFFTIIRASTQSKRRAFFFQFVMLHIKPPEIAVLCIHIFLVLNKLLDWVGKKKKKNDRAEQQANIRNTINMMLSH